MGVREWVEEKADRVKQRYQRDRSDVVERRATDRFMEREREIERREDIDQTTGARHGVSEELADKCMALVRRNGLSDARIYIQITTGSAPRSHLRPSGLTPTLIVTATPAEPVSTNWEEITCRCKLISDERWAGCYIKTTMLLPNAVAKSRAVKEGYDDAIIVRDGYAVESTASNLFAVFGNELWTPPASNYILGGITREVVLDLAKELGIKVEETPIPVQKLFKADELFVTASMTELTAVGEVDEKTIGVGKVGPVLRRLREAFRKRTLEGNG